MPTISITNQVITITLIVDGVSTVLRKDDLRVQAFGDVIRLTDYSGAINEFLYSDCTSPSEASAPELRDAINEFLITASGGGGGGGVSSVNAGTNISITGTATDPIVNSLSDRYKTTSTTSNSVSNGSKSFTIGTNLSYIPLQEILIVYDVSNHMHGEVTSYNSSTGALVVDIKHHTGSGTYTSWVLNLDGTPVDALTGTGTTNEIAYFTAARVLASLSVATYPSLTELSYVKGVTSAIQTQLNGKFPNPTGTTLQFIRGDGSLATFPAIGVGTVTSVSATVPSPASPAFSVAVTNPTTTPAIAITANGTSSQVIAGDGSLASIASISTVSSIFQEDVYITNTAPIGIEYVQSVGKVYVCNLTSGNVTIYDTTNGSLLATVSIANAARIKYIQSINEVWVTSTTLTTITRISPTTNGILGTIAGVTAGGSDFLEYSATKVFLLIGAASGSIIVINPTLLTIITTITVNVPSFPVAMAYNSNVASLQFDKIVITAAAGVFILDPLTNTVSTTLANPSSVFSSGARIFYSATDDKYYAASLVNNRVVVLSIATATTFTATFVGNNLFLNDIKIDDANDLLFTFPLEGGTGQNVLVKVFKKSTMTQIIAFRTSCVGGNGSQSGNGAIDLVNKRIFLTGRNNTANSTVSVIRYL